MRYESQERNCQNGEALCSFANILPLKVYSCFTASLMFCCIHVKLMNRAGNSQYQCKLKVSRRYQGFSCPQSSTRALRPRGCCIDLLYSGYVMSFDHHLQGALNTTCVTTVNRFHNKGNRVAQTQCCSLELRGSQFGFRKQHRMTVGREPGSVTALSDSDRNMQPWPHFSVSWANFQSRQINRVWSVM